MYNVVVIVRKRLGPRWFNNKVDCCWCKWCECFSRSEIWCHDPNSWVLGSIFEIMCIVSFILVILQCRPCPLFLWCILQELFWVFLLVLLQESKKAFGTYKILANIIELKVLSFEKHENKMDLHIQPSEEGHDRM